MLSEKEKFALITQISLDLNEVKDIDLLLDICDNISGKTFCPLGDAALPPIRSSIQLFRNEYLYHINEKRCPMSGHREAEAVPETELAS